jgi:hypothetical protein
LVTVVDEVGPVTVLVRVAVVADSVSVTVVVVGLEVVVVEVDVGAAAAVLACAVVVDEVVADADCEPVVSLRAGAVTDLVVLLEVVGPVFVALPVRVMLALRLLLRLCADPDPHAVTTIVHRATSVPARSNRRDEAVIRSPEPFDRRPL